MVPNVNPAQLQQDVLRAVEKAQWTFDKAHSLFKLLAISAMAPEVKSSTPVEPAKALEFPEMHKKSRLLYLRESKMDNLWESLEKY